LKLLAKVGGTLLDAVESRSRVARELASVSSAGHQMTVVHGGGKQMTRFLKELGVESRFVGGLRVTTPETIDAVLKVFAGSVNKQLVASLIAAGVNAVGLSGVDAALVEAERLHEELGAVGKPGRSNARLLEVLSGAGYLPVVACVAGDRQGHIYNVNADQMAVACAAGFHAEMLVFLTDVDGGLGPERNVIPVLTAAGCQQLIQDGHATGGMQAKLNAATEALQQGVPRVVIAPGSAENILQRLVNGELVGARIEH